MGKRAGKPFNTNIGDCCTTRLSEKIGKIRSTNPENLSSCSTPSLFATKQSDFLSCPPSGGGRASHGRGNLGLILTIGVIQSIHQWVSTEDDNDVWLLKPQSGFVCAGCNSNQQVLLAGCLHGRPSRPLVWPCENRDECEIMNCLSLEMDRWCCHCAAR